MACIITDKAASMHCSVIGGKRKKENPKMAEMSFSIKSIDIKQIYLNRKGTMVLEHNMKQYDMFSQKFGYVRLSFLCYSHNVYVENLNSVCFQSLN